MMMFLVVLTSLLQPAWAGKGDWRKQPIDPKARVAGTAYTVEQFNWKIGLLSQNFGLLDNVQIGTQALPLALGIPNVQGKITAIQTPKFDLAVDAGIYFAELGRFSNTLGFEEGFDAALSAPRLGFWGSWVISKRLSLHFGAGAYFIGARGNVGLADLAAAIVTVAGADIEDELRAALGDSTDVFANVNLGMPQARLAVDFRLNRRDSIVLSSNGFLALTGQFNAGADVKGSDGVDIEGGAYARVSTTLPDTFASFTTLSWQFDWRRVNLRVGIPLNPTNPIAYFQVFDLYLLLGPSRSKRPTGYRDNVEVENPEEALEDEDTVIIEDQLTP
ncbi:MAG: hypothetical protein AAGA48_22920 [Myxococcota bacterium]